MSELICGSCGATNPPDRVYCAKCGETLERSSAPVSGTAGAAALVNRGEIRPAADPSAGLSLAPLLLFRFRKIFLYLVMVGVGVLLVLAFMEPKDYRVADRRVLDPNAIVRRVFADSRTLPSSLSQSTINSFLALQSSYAIESPIRLIAMPAWCINRVELFPACVRTRVTLTLFGLPMRISETFQLKGLPGSWMLQPYAATIGLISVPRFLLPVVTFVTRPAFFCVEPQLATLSAAQTLVIRTGSVEFTTR